MKLSQNEILQLKGPSVFPLKCIKKKLKKIVNGCFIYDHNKKRMVKLMKELWGCRKSFQHTCERNKYMAIQATLIKQIGWDKWKLKFRTVTKIMNLYIKTELATVGADAKFMSGFLWHIYENKKRHQLWQTRFLCGDLAYF